MLIVRNLNLIGVQSRTYLKKIRFVHSSACNDTRDKQIGLITRMITDRIGLHSVLLPLPVVY